MILEARWEESFAQLGSFIEKHGRLPMQCRDGERTLALWMNKQRQKYRKCKTFNVGRIAKLESLPHWSWGRNHTHVRKDFEKTVQQLCDFVEVHKRFPMHSQAKTIENYLAKWIDNQRQSYKRREPHMTADRISTIESIPGWKWDSEVDSIWMRSFEKLKANARIPHANDDLYQWVTRQIRVKNKGKLPIECQRLLESIDGWSWEKRTTRSFAESVEILKEIGHIPTKKEDKQLSIWVLVQRSRYNSKQLSAQNIAVLETIPWWTWNASDAKWNAHFNELKDSRNSKTLSWLYRQRAVHKSGRMPEDRRSRLATIDNFFSQN